MSNEKIVEKLYFIEIPIKYRAAPPYDRTEAP
jgi:hypothetical protein